MLLNQRKMKYNNYLRYFLFLFVAMLLSFQSDAKMKNNSSITYQTTIQKKQKLTFKERFLIKKLKKRVKRAEAKKAKHSDGGSALGKIALGVLLSIVGAFGILGAIVSISLLGLIGSIALIIVGVFVVLWGVLDIPF
jgi:hypothetical protein